MNLWIGCRRTEADDGGGLVLRAGESFSGWFERATGYGPYQFQTDLAEVDKPPAVLAVPTGSGKTQAVLGAWMYQRLVGNRGPRRLVYALPMRTLVEQTFQVATEMRENLGHDAEDVRIHRLMGGADLWKDDWRRRPEDNQILIGTIDMLLSRALNRGYGASRFSWPISFGLLNSDCRWVFDEVQLMGPARVTSAQLDGLRAALGTALPSETMWVSATVDPAALLTADRPELGDVMHLPDADRIGPLRKGLTASKTLERIDLAGAKRAERPREIARLAAERHEAGTRTIVVLNTVDRAQATFAALAKLLDADGPHAVLLHSRFLPPDRQAHMNRALEDPEGPGTIVVATQVIEAGVDFSSRTLLTETAPFSSVVQRLGRCNRRGDDREARVLWLDYGPIEEGGRGEKEAAPYPPVDLNRSRDQLRKLEGDSLSPEALAGNKVEETRDEPATLRRRDLVDLFDTSPDLSGMDIDIAPFIREDDERSVLVCFREIEGGMPTYEGTPGNDEIVQVPLADLRKKNRRCWKADYLNSSWERTSARAVPPGSTLILDAAEGGYSAALGWDGKSKPPAPVIDLRNEEERKPPETEEHNDQGDSPQELLEHLTAVRAEAEMLASAIDLPQSQRAAITAAAALHDVGKAHPAFQCLLRTAMGMDGDAGVGKLWAKSGNQGGERIRRYLRHELASAIAVRSLDGAITLPADRDLIAYLVAAHHGRVRLSIRPAPGEFQPDAGEGKRFALGLVDGDELPAVETPLGSVPATTIDLSCMELGAEDSWTNATTALRDSPGLGPLRLAYLEAVLRISDWRASA